MTTDNKLTIIAIIGVTIIFLGLDYHILQSQDLNAIIGDATATVTPATLSPSPASVTASASVCVLKQYKLLINVDECKLGTYAKGGWNILQAGTVIEQGGRAADCNAISLLNIDWAILQKSSASHTCF